MKIEPLKELDPTLIFNSLNFVQSITRNYGAEQGMAMWDTIADTIDRRLKLEVFKAMMSVNQSEGVVIITGAHPSADTIKLIKTLRQYTSYGLKDAKDDIEDLRKGMMIEVTVPYHEHPKAVQDFRAAGFIL